VTGVSNQLEPITVEPARAKWLAFAAGLVVLDASLSFASLWPTPGIRWTGQLSVECAVLVLGLALAWHVRGRPPAWALRVLAGVWMLLALGRYAAVTSSALFGRDINLYWDSRHFSAVAAMLARVASPLELAGVVLAALAIPLAVYGVLRWALGRVSAGMAGTTARRAVAGGCLAIIAFFAVERLTIDQYATPIMPSPITSTYLRQAGMVADVLLGRNARSLGEEPSLPADLSALGGADILLVFVESYGAVAYDRPAFSTALEAGRVRFAAQAKAAGLDVVSAFVESPTFGGSSWLAHVSFLTGVEVKDEGTNVRMMAQRRRTLVTELAARGYRTVAVMPGLQERWPEGAFYGFDRIYDTQTLAYTGPSFGWWPIPDQFALAQLEHLELASRDRAPVFAFLPTTSTHTPFSPTPPYQTSWPRMLTSTPYDEAEYQKAWAEPPDWLNLGPSYIRSMDYVMTSLGGFLALPRTRDVVLVLIGDHQPPAVVSGEGAPWDVPVHVVSNRRAFLDAMTALGFSRGMHPSRAPLMRLHELMPALTSAMGSHTGGSARPAKNADRAQYLANRLNAGSPLNPQPRTTN
jgi:hypothetical protein